MCGLEPRAGAPPASSRVSGGSTEASCGGSRGARHSSHTSLPHHQARHGSHWPPARAQSGLERGPRVVPPPFPPPPDRPLFIFTSISHLFHQGRAAQIDGRVGVAPVVGVAGVAGTAFSLDGPGLGDAVRLLGCKGKGEGGDGKGKVRASASLGDRPASGMGNPGQVKLPPYWCTFDPSSSLEGQVSAAGGVRRWTAACIGRSPHLPLAPSAWPFLAAAAIPGPGAEGNAHARLAHTALAW